MSEPTNGASAPNSSAPTENLADIGDAVETAVEGNEASEGSHEAAAPVEKAQLEATIKDPKASKTEKKEAQKQLRKIKYQVDGQEYEEEFDPNDDEYMKEQLQFAKVARKRMNEKAILEKELIQFINDVKKNPRKALSDPAIGLDLKELAAQIIEEEIENSKKSPEQLKSEQLENELKELKDQRDREKNEREEQDRIRLTEQEFERLDMQMTQALDKHNFPKTSAVIKRMADYLLIGLEAGKDVTPEDIIPLIREELKNDYKEILNSMPDDDALEEYIGKEFVDRVRKKNIAKAKKSASNPAVKAGAKPASTGQKPEASKEPDKKTTFRQYFGV